MNKQKFNGPIHFRISIYWSLIIFKNTIIGHLSIIVWDQIDIT